jgi:hypothetical protein
MTAWLKSLRDRPIADGERGAAMVTVTVLLIAAAILLVLSQPGGRSRRPSQQRHSVASVVASAPAPRARASENVTASLTPGVVHAADLFLTGYLAYLYGHGSASQIKGATSALVHSLKADPPRVSPVMRTLKAHVLALHTIPAPSGLVGVSALVNDGGLIDYSIGLILTPEDGQWLVSALEGDE